MLGILCNNCLECVVKWSMKVADCMHAFSRFEPFSSDFEGRSSFSTFWGGFVENEDPIVKFIDNCCCFLHISGRYSCFYQ